MGFSSTCKFVSLGLRTRVFRKFRGQPTKSYDWIRNKIDKLIRDGRIEVTLPKAKELQQYAEEVMYHAKQDNEKSDLIVESVIRSPESRSLLYEKYVPLYRNRSFFFTRVVNQFRLRGRDSSPMAFLEFVDRDGEIYPARPVGVDKLEHILGLMRATRRDYRRYYQFAKRNGLLDSNGKLVEGVNSDNKLWFENPDNISTVDEKSLKDKGVLARLGEIRGANFDHLTSTTSSSSGSGEGGVGVRRRLKFNP